MSWCPHVTVAAVIESEGRFLLVEEEQPEGRVLNQPAGHLEPGETLLDAVVREVDEETGLAFRPEKVVGLYRWRHPERDVTFIRLALTGNIPANATPAPRDPEIIRTHWLARSELGCTALRLRSPLVTRCIDDFLAGARHPLSLLGDLSS